MQTRISHRRTGLFVRGYFLLQYANGVLTRDPMWVNSPPSPRPPRATATRLPASHAPPDPSGATPDPSPGLHWKERGKGKGWREDEWGLVPPLRVEGGGGEGGGEGVYPPPRPPLEFGRLHRQACPAPFSGLIPRGACRRALEQALADLPGPLSSRSDPCDVCFSRTLVWNASCESSAQTFPRATHSHYF